ncbi:MAG: NAD-dependent epimerase/dehydratase family protein [Gammaproteobacteria bacterium]|nr:NAD-dependent epimerase/dehydratase family protein [Gammaproteobacteria bacterium]
MTQEKIRILVVGGTGFIGSHVVNHAAQLGWDVTSLSLRAGKRNGYPSVRYLSGNIVDSDDLKKVLDNVKFEYVVNCGGYIDHTLFFRGGRNVFDSHFRGVLNLAETLDRDVLRAFVNIGSSDEYGSASAPQVETQREAPISPYSLGKVAATHFLQMLYRTENFPATTLRLFLTYGPGQDNRRFLPQIILGCLEDRSFPVSKGAQMRDFCFVQDVVDAVFLTFDSSSVKGEVINIASGQSVSIRAIIETVQRLIGRGKPLFGKIDYRPSENMRLHADISKAKAFLGWEPNVTLEVGLEKTIQWIRQQL